MYETDYFFINPHRSGENEKKDNIHELRLAKTGLMTPTTLNRVQSVSSVFVIPKEGLAGLVLSRAFFWHKSDKDGEAWFCVMQFTLCCTDLIMIRLMLLWWGNWRDFSSLKWGIITFRDHILIVEFNPAFWGASNLLWQSGNFLQYFRGGSRIFRGVGAETDKWGGFGPRNPPLTLSNGPKSGVDSTRGGGQGPHP